MSQQSLASKKITKKNVAQSSVIFSVVVAVITLGVIATMAYVDIKEEISTVAKNKSIPEMIAEQKLRSEESRKQTELASQAEDLVVTMDQRVEELKKLEENVQQVNEQLNFISATLQSNNAQVLTPAKPKAVIKPIKTVQMVNQPLSQNNNEFNQQLNGVLEQSHALNINSKQQAAAQGDVFFEVSWLFKARGSMDMQQQYIMQKYLKAQNQWNAKSF